MRILAFSDLHRDAAMAAAVVRECPDADVVVGAGDFATRGLGLQDTLPILRQIAVPFVLVPGNHDDLRELRTACVDWPLAQVLHGQSVLVNDVAFFGIGLGSGVVNPEPWNKALDEDRPRRCSCSVRSGRCWFRIRRPTASPISKRTGDTMAA